MRTVILCGGRGTRAYPYTVDLPKPLLDVAGQPILRHVMGIFAAQGHTDFVLAAGFRADLIEEFAAGLPSAWAVDVRDTGERTNTGARVRAVRDLLDDDFFLTYGDGVGDVDLRALAAFHGAHTGRATVTTVPLPSPYGTIHADGTGKVTDFREKPRLTDHWINAGFLVVSPSAFDGWHGDDLEREVLPALAAAGELFAYRHHGFWRSMDTYKDALELTTLAAAHPGGNPPWIPSTAPAS